MNKIIEILTSDDQTKIKTAIVDMIIEKIQQDLDDWAKNEYFLAPDVTELVEESVKEAENQFKDYVSKYYLEKMKADFIKIKGE